MNLRFKYLAGSAIALSLVAGAAVLKYDSVDPDTATASSLAGVAAGMRFTDEQGNARIPSVAERTALAEAFQADLAELTRGKNIPKGSKREPNGSVSAVVGADKLRFLTVEIDEAGNARFGHADIDADRSDAAVNDWPEM